MSNVLAGLADVIDVWVGHSSDVIPRLLDVFGPGCVDMAFFDQKGTLYQNDLAMLMELGLLADGAVVVADNVIKPGAPIFLYQLHHCPYWNLQNISLREYSSEAIEDWMSVSIFNAHQYAKDKTPMPAAPHSYEVLAFETDTMRWRAMTEQLNVSDWVRFAARVRAGLEEQGICITATVTDGEIHGLEGIQHAAKGQGQMRHQA